MLSSRLIALSLLLPCSIAGAQAGTQNNPYTATEKTTRIQKLVDGTTITNISTRKMARDSQGRTIQITTQDRLMNGRTFTQTFVNDPTTHTTTSWNSLSNSANVMHQNEPGLRMLASPPPPPPPPPQGVVTPTSGTVVGGVMGGVGTTTNPDSNDRPKTQREKLGGKTIAGIYTEGNRMTTTYPVGFMGNDRPIVVVQETWTAPDLRLTVLRTMDDPRSGQSTTEVTDLQRSEPDPALFQIPEGYTIKDQYPNN